MREVAIQMRVSSREEGSERSRKGAVKGQSPHFQGLQQVWEAPLSITSAGKKSRKQSKKIPGPEEQIR